MYKNKFTKKNMYKNEYERIFEYLLHHNLRNVFLYI